MKLTKLRAALLTALVVLAPLSALAQTVVAVPTVVASRTVVDLGNGPTEVRVAQGNLGLFTSSGTGVGSTSGSSTTLTLTATAAANPPCVGCIISGTGITSGTTVSAFNGTTGITLSAAMTVAASTALAWGQACPSAPPTNPLLLVQAGVGADLPLYTQARVCAYGGNGPGGLLIQFALGAH
jgi:hypothetical protein